MSNLWKTRTPPKPLKWKEFNEENTTETGNNLLPNQKIWGILECANIFEKSILQLKEEFSKLKEGDHLVWDKDDVNGMNFVTACANIRAHIFGIPKKSLFDIKSMAGNIIPAIATTNAITAGFVVLHAYKILQSNYSNCQSVYVRLRPNPRNQIFISDKKLSSPNPKCAVCSQGTPEIKLEINTKETTVKSLKENILLGEMGIELAEAMLEGKGLIVISSEEDEETMNDDKKLSELGIVDGCVLKVEDMDKDTEERIIIIHTEFMEGGKNYKFQRISDAKKIKALSISNAEPEKDTSIISDKQKNVMDVDEDDDDVCVVSEGIIEKPDLKRKMDENDDIGPAPSKKFKNIIQNDDDDLIIIN